MKPLPSLLLLLALPAVALPQQPVNDAVTWSVEAEPVKSASGEQLYRLRLEGRIAGGYIIYGSDFKAELGPNPTRLRFAADSGVTARGELESAGTLKGKDKAFNVDYTYFEGQARLTQVVAVAAGTPKIIGTVSGQTCREADGVCALFRASVEAALPQKP